MPRTQIIGRQVDDGTIEEQDLAPGSVIASKLGIGAIIGTDIQPFSDALLGVERITNINSNTVITPNHNGLLLVNASIGNLTLNLPPAASCTGFTFLFKKIDASTNIILLSARPSEPIDGSITLQISLQYEWVEIKSNGSGWTLQSKGPLSTASASLPMTLSGLPGYIDPNVPDIVSIDRSTLHFTRKGGGPKGKNVYLNFEDVTGAVARGIPLIRNAYLISVVVSISKVSTAVSSFHVRTVSSGAVNLHTVNIPIGLLSAKAENIWLSLGIDEQLQVYGESTKGLENPFCQLELCWR